MSGYIGKIAAIVTANTSDFTSKLAGTKKELNAFGASIRSTITSASNSAGKSFDAIFTPLQRLQRALEAATKSPLNLRTDDQVRKLQSLISLSEGLAKPLTAATRQFEQLSQEAQANFLPALIRSQTAVKALQTQLETTGRASGSGFEQARRQIEQTTQAVQRLAQAQQVLSSGPRAESLAFVDPRALQALQASAAIRQQASQLPPPALADGRVRQQVGNLSAVDNRIAEARARIESIQARPKVDATELAAARKELERLLAGAERIRAGIQVRIDAQKAIADVTSLNARLDELQENANLVITGQPQSLRQVEAELVRILGRFDELTEAQRQPLGAQFTQVADALRAGNLPEAIQNFQTLAASVELAANETERLARANSQLGIVPDQPPPPPPSSDLGDRLAESGRQRVRDLTGNLNLDATPVPGVFNEQAQRDIDALGARVGAVRQQLEALPNSVRTQFIPALQQAQQQLVALQNAPGATVAQIENAANAVERIEQNARAAKQALNFQASFGGGSIAGLQGVFDERELQGYTAQLQVLQQTLGRVSAEARGPALPAFNRLGQVISDAMIEGTLGTTRLREQIRVLTEEAVEVTARVAGVGAGRLGRQVQRSGDIATGNFQNVGFAVNQLAFAVDDFFSVTGGAEQRIRAIGNNITQFGLIIGGTAGLVAALATVLTAQGVVAFIRYSNGGASAEQRAKVLNEALARQKSLVEDLAQAFKSLGDTLSNKVFSAPAGEARKFGREIDEIAKKQRNLIELRAADLDPDVQRSRIRQETLQETFDGSDSPARRVALQREINEERARELEATRNAASRTGSGAEVRAAVAASEAVFLRRDRRESGLRGFDLERQARADEVNTANRVAAIPLGNRPEDIRAQRAALEASAERSRGETGASFFDLGLAPSAAGGSELIELQRLITALEAPLIQALDELTNEILRASSAAGIEIEAAQADVADAIRRGVRGAGDFQAALDNTARQLDEANAQLTAAQDIENDPDRREVEVRRAQDRVRDVGNRLDAINERASEIRLGRTFGGERTTAALSGLGRDRFIGEETGLRARLVEAIDAEVAARTSLEAATKKGDDAARNRAIADLEAAQAVSDLAAAAGEAAQASLEALARVSTDLANNVAQEARGSADQARRDANRGRGILDAGLGGRRGDVEASALRRDRLAEVASTIERQAAKVAESNARAEVQFQREAQAGKLGELAQGLILQRDQALATIDNQKSPQEAVINAQATLNIINTELQRIFEQSGAGQAAAKLADELDQAAAAAAQQEEQLALGEKLIAGDAAEAAKARDTERAAALKARADALAQNAADLKAGDIDRDEAARRNLEAIGGAGAALENADRKFFESVAPNLLSLSDQAANAVLQGPSRAALEATDVSTTEGASELSRLLRGDDAAKNQDLVTLQREANALLREIANAQAQVAN